MFTGIIQTVGKVAALQMIQGDLRLYVQATGIDWSRVALGDSIATNGVCLTAVELPGDGYWADVSAETLRLSSLGKLKQGDKLNLELAMTPESHFGGHMVAGHVDGLGEITAIYPDARAVRYRIKAPNELAKYIAAKGSITVDGTSLTVNEVDGAEFLLNIVPHTAQETIVSSYRVGSRVNLEVDLVARYLERLLLGDKAAKPSGEKASSGGVDMELLAKAGFLK